MAEASEEFQAAVIAALRASPRVTALVPAELILDGRPAALPDRCIVIGDAQVLRADADLVDARVAYLDLDVWSNDGGRRRIALAICDAISAVLHRPDLEAAPFDLPTHALAMLEVERVECFLDQDGVTAHGVVQLLAEIEER